MNLGGLGFGELLPRAAELDRLPEQQRARRGQPFGGSADSRGLGDVGLAPLDVGDDGPERVELLVQRVDAALGVRDVAVVERQPELKLRADA